MQNQQNTTEESTSGEQEQKISKHKFFFETPLYDVIYSKNVEDIHDGDVDAYSAKNGIDTTYKISSREVDQFSFENFYKITLTCKRKDNDVLRFFVYDNDEIVVKLGQLPSLVDIQFEEVSKKYDKYLSRDALKEFKRAIGLVTHGVGVGSFVYLRRIFENLIYETFDKHSKNLNITKDEFSKKRMEDKIDILKDYLPSQLLSMKSIYSILSKGIHELDEQTCLKYFPAIKLSIELILDQKIDIETKEKKDDEVKNQIQNITSEVSGKS